MCVSEVIIIKSNDDWYYISIHPYLTTHGLLSSKVCLLYFETVQSVDEEQKLGIKNANIKW